MKLSILGLCLVGVLIAICLAGTPQEESWTPEVFLFTYEKDEEMMVAKVSLEQSRTPEIVFIAQKTTEEREEEPVIYENWASQEERRRFVKVAVAFSGTPYKRGGITAQGMDCSGFTYMVYRLFGIQLPRTVAKQYLVGRHIDRYALEEGDLVFFDGTGKPMHVGIYLGDGKFIHASSAAKQIRTDFIDTPWQFKRYIVAARIRELKNPRESR